MYCYAFQYNIMKSHCHSFESEDEVVQQLWKEINFVYIIRTLASNVFSENRTVAYLYDIRCLTCEDHTFFIFIFWWAYSLVEEEKKVQLHLWTCFVRPVCFYDRVEALELCFHLLRKTWRNLLIVTCFYVNC